MAVTLNPSDKYVNEAQVPLTLSNNNLTAERESVNGPVAAGVRATLGHATGKWYFEVQLANWSQKIWSFGVMTAAHTLAGRVGDGSTGYGWYGYAVMGYSRLLNNASSVGDGANIGFTLTGTGEYGRFCIDIDAGKIWIGRGLTWYNSGDPAAGTNPTWSGVPGANYFPAVGMGYGRMTFGFGDALSAVLYTIPAGFKSWGDIPPPVSNGVDLRSNAKIVHYNPVEIGMNGLIIYPALQGGFTVHGDAEIVADALVTGDTGYIGQVAIDAFAFGITSTGKQTTIAAGALTVDMDVLSYCGALGELEIDSFTVASSALTGIQGEIVIQLDMNMSASGIQDPTIDGLVKVDFDCKAAGAQVNIGKGLVNISSILAQSRAHANCTGKGDIKFNLSVIGEAIHQPRGNCTVDIDIIPEVFGFSDRIFWNLRYGEEI